MPPIVSPKPAIIDTDAFNEIDDQFTLVYALSSPDTIALRGITAAPFFNARSDSPADGMEKSYREIQKILQLTGREAIPVRRGAAQFMNGRPEIIPSPAVDFIIETAKTVHRTGEKLLVYAIAAATNIGSALLQAPEIAEMISVVWLGGHQANCSRRDEFNLRQDPGAVRIMLQSGCDLVRLPCLGVVEALRTTREEIESALGADDPVSAYLRTGFDGYLRFKGLTGKVLWDIATVAWRNVPEAFTFETIPVPDLTMELEWLPTRNSRRMIEVTKVDRDRIFTDLFRRINQMTEQKAW